MSWKLRVVAGGLLALAPAVLWGQRSDVPVVGSLPNHQNAGGSNGVTDTLAVGKPLKSGVWTPRVVLRDVNGHKIGEVSATITVTQGQSTDSKAEAGAKALNAALPNSTAAGKTGAIGAVAGVIAASGADGSAVADVDIDVDQDTSCEWHKTGPNDAGQGGALHWRPGMTGPAFLGGTTFGFHQVGLVTGIDPAGAPSFVHVKTPCADVTVEVLPNDTPLSICQAIRSLAVAQGAQAYVTPDGEHVWIQGCERVANNNTEPGLSSSFNQD